MPNGKTVAFVLALLFMITGLIPIIIGTDGAEGPPSPPPVYHNGYIHFDVEDWNGTPAANYRIYHRTSFYGSLSTYYDLDANGEGILNLTFDKLGVCVIKVRDKDFKHRYYEQHLVDPDQHLYLNLTLDPPPDPYNTVTGILTNGSSGEPLAGVQVRLSGDTDYWTEVYIYNTTDSQGRFNFLAPNMTRTWTSLYISSFGNFRSGNGLLFMKKGVNHYEMNITMYEEFDTPMQNRFRYILMPGGIPLTGSAGATIYPKDNGFMQESSSVTGPDGQGWYEFDGAFGEGNFYFYPSQELLPNTSMNFDYFYVQSTSDLELEIPVDLSNFVPVDLTVVNSSGPIFGAGMGFNMNGYSDFGRYYMSYQNYTDANGTMRFHIAKNDLRTLRVYSIGHSEKYFEVNTKGPGPYEYEVILEEFIIEEPPLTNLTITLLDEETGLPIPTARLVGSHKLDYNFNIEGYTDDNGQWSGKAYSGEYNYISCYTNLGEAKVENVVIGAGIDNSLTLYFVRRNYEPFKWGEHFHFYLKDASGDPLPGIWVYVAGRSGPTGSYGWEFLSDKNGRIEIMAVPGTILTIETMKNLQDRSPNEWAPVRQMIELPETGGQLPDITMYRRGDYFSIYGFLMDSSSMEPLSYRKIECKSVYDPPGQPTRNGMYPEYYMDGAEFMDLWRFSTYDGFYRTWAAETAQISVDIPGYFPFEERLDMNTRGEKNFNIFLDPFPDETAWINGTLKDQDGSPISGFLNITDIDHPAQGGLDIEINGTGKFHVLTYPGNFTLRYYNETLEDTLDIMLTVEGIEDLELMLIPFAEISGRVVNSIGSPLEWINVTLEKQLVNGTELFGWEHTNADGNFSFTVTRGTYDIVIKASELYERYIVNDITTDGWTDWYSTLYLTNRTFADVAGTVLGSGGPYADGIPGAAIYLWSGGNVTSPPTISDANGDFLIKDVQHGTYTLEVKPPENLRRIEGLRSGYLANTTTNFTVYGAIVEVDPVLVYSQETSPGYVNITYNKPNGTDVYLDTPIIIEFSEVMNKSTVETSITFDPGLSNISFKWDEWGYLVTITHAPFEPNTTYTVTVGYGAISAEGWPLFSEMGFSWSFTTGMMMDPWKIFTADVKIVQMNVSVEVTAPENLSIFIAISNVGYFEVPESSSGEYSLVIESSNFEYDTTYSYFFTDRDNGDIKAPQFAGTFTTPEDPDKPPAWQITFADVTIRDNGDWIVNVEGSEGMTVYIVIDNDVGSFKLSEGPPGEYEILIKAENFEEGVEYTYYFSDSEGGQDLAPGFRGTLVQPVAGDDDDDDDGSYTGLCIAGVIILLLVIVAVIILVVVITRKKGEDEGWGEE
ncbi:MAG: Ig-like domain-containing protein [Thermoplasmatota archaeon]